MMCMLMMYFSKYSTDKVVQVGMQQQLLLGLRVCSPQPPPLWLTWVMLWMGSGSQGWLQ
jgi:hypothetical protein